MPSPAPHRWPRECFNVEVRLRGKLVAVSYLYVGEEPVSSVYAFFGPVESRCGLGTLTLLEKIQGAESQGKHWLYPGLWVPTTSPL